MNGHVGPAVLRTASAILVCVSLFAGCTPDRGPSDEEIAARVEAALTGASDVPTDGVEVDVADGVVRLTGRITCEDCGGQRTPAGIGTVQQSIGAIVRAVPGVDEVEFDFEPEG